MNNNHHSSNLPTPPLLSTISCNKMSSTSNNNQVTIEHIVLFKASPTAAHSSISTMINKINSLSSLPYALHLSVRPISSCRSNSLTFTHMLHSRYASKSDLASYIAHPDHVSVVTNYVNPVVDDVMVVDWVSEDSAEIAKGLLARFAVLKLKEESGKNEVLEVLKKNGFSSVGENFSPGKAKGYSIGSVAVSKGSEELEGLDWFDGKEEFVEDALVLDFVV